MLTVKCACRFGYAQPPTKHRLCGGIEVCPTWHIFADENHTDQAQLSQSNPRCPFGGRGSEKSLQPEQPPTSASDEGKALNLSVSFPPRDYLAFKDEAYKIDLRLERTTVDDIFEIDEEYEADMKRKAHILATRPAKMMLPEVPGVSIICPMCPRPCQMRLALLTSKACKIFLSSFLKSIFFFLCGP